MTTDPKTPEQNAEDPSAAPEQPQSAAAKQPADSKSQAKSKNRAANQAAVALMCETYPKAFDRDNVRPLKIGIQEDILVDDKVSKTKAKRALASYVRAPQYHKSLVAGAERIDLNGEPAGTVSEQEAEHAKDMLKQMRERRNERIKQERAAQKKERQQQHRKEPKKKREEPKENSRKESGAKEGAHKQSNQKESSHNENNNKGQREDRREQRFNDKLSQLLNKHQH